MRKGISSTALYGDVSRGDRVIDSRVKENMREILREIESGEFYAQMQQEFASGKPMIQTRLARDAQHPIERAVPRL